MGSLDTRLHELEARVAALEWWKSFHIEQRHAGEAGGPEPAAGEPICICDWGPGGVVLSNPFCKAKEHRKQRDSRPAPAQAARPAPCRCGHPKARHYFGDSGPGFPDQPKCQVLGCTCEAYKPAPQQPRSCDNCIRGWLPVANDEPCRSCMPTRDDLGDQTYPSWQPRGGGGAL